MKRKAILTLVGILASFACTRVQAQTFTAGHTTAIAMPAMSHDSTLCSSQCNSLYTIMVDSSYVGDTVLIIDATDSILSQAYVDTIGTSPWTFAVTLPLLNNFVNDNNLVGGSALFMGHAIKLVRATDTIPSLLNNFSLPVPYPCGYGALSGRVYVDNNGNCTYDAGDQPLEGIWVNESEVLTSPSMSGLSIQNFTDVTGAYAMSVQQSWMSSYTVSLPSAYAFIFPTSACFSGSYTFTTLPVTNADFPLQCTGNDDVMCWVLTNSFARPATGFFVYPTVSNTGCDSISGRLTLIKDSRVLYDASLTTNAPDSVMGDTLVWHYNNLTNLSAGGYWNSFVSGLHLVADTSLHAGDTLCFHIYADVPATDIYPANNDYTVCIPVVASYDPNLKQVAPAGSGASGLIPATTDSLVYTIHFQNTGTGTAYNVSVVDTLDSHLTASSLRILAVSNNMNPEWLAPGVVRFNFNGILLPDSTDNEAGSHGALSFSIKLHSALPEGTQIQNTANIYFDYNPPVPTNTTLNTIEGITGVNNITNAALAVYPNPTSDGIYISGTAAGMLSMTNVEGRVVLQQAANSSGRTYMDMSSLPSGVYFLKASSANASTVVKVIRQ